jgi:hypothetical protein
MAFWVPLAMMAASAVAANQKQKQQQANADSQRKLASETARYSPWTGMTPNQVQEPGSTAFGATLGGGISGFAGGMGMQNSMGAPKEAPMTADQQTAWDQDSDFNSKYLSQRQPASRSTSSWGMG